MKKIIILGPNEEAIAQFNGRDYDSRDDVNVVTVGFNWKKTRKWNTLIFVEDFNYKKIHTFRKDRPQKIISEDSELPLKSAMQFGSNGLPWPASDDYFNNSYFYRALWWSIFHGNVDEIAIMGFEEEFTDEDVKYIKKRALEERTRIVKLDNLSPTLELEFEQPRNY